MQRRERLRRLLQRRVGLCVSGQTRRQFCATVDASMAFPLGDTLLTVRVRDQEGRPGDPAQLIVRVLHE